MAKYRDALVLKGCDRKDNLDTLGDMPRAKQRAKAQETLDHQVPALRDAGLIKLANQLEELARGFV